MTENRLTEDDIERIVTQDEMVENPEWALRKQLDALTIDFANEKAARAAAEERIKLLIEGINEQEARIATAWRERDQAVQNFREIDKLLLAAIGLLAFFAGRRP